ncbi:MAG TPA: hypothetical protein VHT91_25805 [Kofleriaceae bacterium]|jgi:hypothetical protein|nr:hypothetical protein [Kofleriaceae bacterium]
MKTWHAIVVLSLLAATATWCGQRRQRSETEQLRSSVRALSQSLDQTERAVARAAVAPLRTLQGVDHETPEPGPSPREAAAPVQQPSSAPDEPAKQPPIDPATLRTHLNARFDRQADDPAWSAAARGMIETKLASAMPPASVLRSVECRETMCRIEMVYDDLAQYHAFVKRMTPDALPWNGTLFSTPLGNLSDGPVTFVAFLSREGQPLPVE